MIGAAYAVVHAVPSVEDYRRLCAAAGLSDKTREAAERGLAGTLFAVQILHDGQPVGMGRVVGDGGTAYQVVDIAVLPAHQKQGLGKRIMEDIMGYLRAHAPVSAYVSLIADGDARHLYARFGFADTMPASIGMGYCVRPPAA